jgi:hypothetical protein
MRALLLIMLVAVPLLAQVFLPARRISPRVLAPDPGPPFTNELGLATGEHPVVFEGKVYVSMWDNNVLSDAGLAIIDAYSGEVTDTIVVTNTTTDSAPLRDANGKWHLWAYNGALFRLNEATLSVEATVSGFNAIDWETPVATTSGSRIIVPLVGAAAGLKAISASDYTTSIWTNTGPSYLGLSSITPSLLEADGHLWALDHTAKLWKLSLVDGSTVSSIQPVVSAGSFQYASPIYDPDNDQIYYSVVDNRTYYCLNPNAMTNKWTYQAPSPYVPHRPACYRDNKVYLQYQTSSGPFTILVACVNAVTGAEVWRQTGFADFGLRSGSPLMDDDYWWVGSYDEAFVLHNLYALDADTGDFAAVTPITSNASSGIPQIWRGKMFAPLWTNGLQVVQVRAAGTGDDRQWKADTNHTGNVTSNSTGALEDAVDSLDVGLVSVWHFEEGTGVNAADSVGSNTLTQNNAPVDVAGIHGQGKQFTAASTQSFTRADTTSINFTRGFTYVVWVQMAATNANTQIISKYDQYYLDWFASSNAFRFVIHGVSGNQLAASTTAGPPALNTWYMLAAYYDDVYDKVGIGMNNTFNEATSTEDQTVAAVDLTFGKLNLNSQYLSGKMDEAMLWKRRLTTTELTRLYNAGAGRFYPGWTP